MLTKACSWLLQDQQNHDHDTVSSSGCKVANKKFHLQTSTLAGCYTYIRLVKVHSRDESGANTERREMGIKKEVRMPVPCDAVTLCKGHFQDILFTRGNRSTWMTIAPSRARFKLLACGIVGHILIEHGTGQVYVMRFSLISRRGIVNICVF